MDKKLDILIIVLVVALCTSPWWDKMGSTIREYEHAATIFTTSLTSDPPPASVGRLDVPSSRWGKVNDKPIEVPADGANIGMSVGQNLGNCTAVSYSAVSWIHVADRVSVEGSCSALISVDRNEGRAREANMLVGGTTVTIKEKGFLPQ